MRPRSRTSGMSTVSPSASWTVAGSIRASTSTSTPTSVSVSRDTFSQRWKLVSISSVRSSSRRENHGAPTSTWSQTRRSAAVTSSGGISPATACTSVWTRVPATAGRESPSRPPYRSSIQRSEQVPSASTLDGERVSGPADSDHRGISELGATRPYHWSGCAPGTPASASSASMSAAAFARSVGVSVAAHTSARNSATSDDSDSTRRRPGSTGSSSSISSSSTAPFSTIAANSPMNREGAASPLPSSTALTISRSRARVHATSSSRRSSARAIAVREMVSSASASTPSRRSTNCPVPRMLPRLRRLGHKPS